jgi:homoserine dehydrogenase
MIAKNHEFLIKKSQENKVSFLYEAVVCGSVPIIRNLEEYFDNDLLKSIKGIVNGSTNFILSKMTTDNAPYDKVLKIAQENGFAESNPTLDVEGIYAKYKLSIITLHALGKRVKPEDIVCQGITSLHPFDFQYANEKNRVIKLIARCNPSENGEIISLSVFPIFLKKDSPLASTHNEYNGVIVESSLADSQFFYGKGAGRYPTSSAVLSDISASLYDYKYSYNKGILASIPTYDCEAKFFISYQGNKFQLLQSLFENIEEKVESKGRNYVIGNIKLKKLNDSQLLNQRNYSIIQID